MASNQYSAYMLDPEHGWLATHRLSLVAAIEYSKEHRRYTAGGLVAIVPDDADPEPYLRLVTNMRYKQRIQRAFGRLSLVPVAHN